MIEPAPVRIQQIGIVRQIGTAGAVMMLPDGRSPLVLGLCKALV
jgi:hypothetical protein